MRVGGRGWFEVEVILTRTGYGVRGYVLCICMIGWLGAVPTRDGEQEVLRMSVEIWDFFI